MATYVHWGKRDRISLPDEPWKSRDTNLDVGILLVPSVPFAVIPMADACLIDVILRARAPIYLLASGKAGAEPIKLTYDGRPCGGIQCRAEHELVLQSTTRRVQKGHSGSPIVAIWRERIVVVGIAKQREGRHVMVAIRSDVLGSWLRAEIGSVSMMTCTASDQR